MTERNYNVTAKIKWWLKLLFVTGIFKTLRFNFHYFGFRGLIHPYVFLNRHVKIQKLKGTVKVPDSLSIAGVKIGYHHVTGLDHKSRRSVWENYGEIHFGGGVNLCSGTGISNLGYLQFGDGTYITANTNIFCHKRIVIGDNCFISWDVQIMDSDHHKLFSFSGGGYTDPLNPPEDIEIGDHCWICSRCLILKGVKLPSNTVLAAGSTVTGGLQLTKENCIVGDKNKIIKENITWKR